MVCAHSFDHRSQLQSQNEQLNQQGLAGSGSGTHSDSVTVIDGSKNDSGTMLEQQLDQMSETTVTVDPSTPAGKTKADHDLERTKKFQDENCPCLKYVFQFTLFACQCLLFCRGDRWWWCWPGTRKEGIRHFCRQLSNSANFEKVQTIACEPVLL